MDGNTFSCVLLGQHFAEVKWWPNNELFRYNKINNERQQALSKYYMQVNNSINVDDLKATTT